MASNDNMIAALKRERAGYVSRGLTERVAEVDAEISRLQGDEAVEADGPQGRTETPKQTADQSAPAAKKTAAKKTAATPPAE